MTAQMAQRKPRSAHLIIKKSLCDVTCSSDTQHGWSAESNATTFTSGLQVFLSLQFLELAYTKLTYITDRYLSKSLFITVLSVINMLNCWEEDKGGGEGTVW